MATQLLDTELDVCRKYLHFCQRDLYEQRFSGVYDGLLGDSDAIIKYCLNRIKYWRIRYNAAMAIEQSREISRSDLELFND
jgi:hypothetical protein